MDSSLDRSSTRLTRREILALGPMALAGAAVLQRRAFAQSGETEFVEVKTKYGSLRGARDRGVAIFRGVPYGGSVSGSRPLQSRASAEALDRRSRRAATRCAFPAAGQNGFQPRTRAGRGLPLPERVVPRARRTQAAGHVLQPRRRLHHRLRRIGLSGWRQPGAHLGCRSGGQQSPPRPHGLPLSGRSGRPGICHLG